MGVHLYIHFPYCLYKCLYCDFNSYAYSSDKIPYVDYTKSLLLELEQRQKFYLESGKYFFSEKESIETIFFGGGTPSLMEAPHLESILNYIQKYFKISPQAEITLEANPATLDQKKISEFIQVGINRISLGVQSLNDNYLHQFGRIHSADEARQTLNLLQNSKLKSWNADMIFGFPQQSFSEWKEDLEEIVSYDSSHLSCYAFTVEADAPYGKMVEKGQAKSPEDDLQAEMLAYTSDYLGKFNFEAYEISNFAKKSQYSQHNLSYWDYKPYLGIGCGAVSLFYHEQSQDFSYRTTNHKFPKDYLESLNQKKDFFIEESISMDQARFEFLMMGLRKNLGIDEQRFEDLFGEKPSYYYDSLLKKYRKLGWIDQKAFRLTKEGRIWINQILVDFLS